jgi:hypothetical protein
MTPPPTPQITPEFRAWVEHEHAWGREALHALTRQRGLLLTETHGRERFAIRMALVDLTGSVARWGNGLHAGLEKEGHAETAALFASAPPFAASDPRAEDYDHLGEYLQARMQALGDLLAKDAP